MHHSGVVIFDYNTTCIWYNTDIDKHAVIALPHRLPDHAITLQSDTHLTPSKRLVHECQNKSYGQFTMQTSPPPSRRKTLESAQQDAQSLFIMLWKS